MVAAGWYWMSLQSTPRYVAVRAAKAAFEDPGSLGRVPLQPDELRKFGLSQEDAKDLLEAVRTEFIPGARIVAIGEFVDQPGKDNLHVIVEMEDGVEVSTYIPVISEGGRGVVQFGDLIAAVRFACVESTKMKADGVADPTVLNPVTDLLNERGMYGYFYMNVGSIEPWPVYEQKGL